MQHLCKARNGFPQLLLTGKSFWDLSCHGQPLLFKQHWYLLQHVHLVYASTMLRMCALLWRCTSMLSCVQSTLQAQLFHRLETQSHDHETMKINENRLKLKFYHGCLWLASSKTLLVTVASHSRNHEISCLANRRKSPSGHHWALSDSLQLPTSPIVWSFRHCSSLCIALKFWRVLQVLAPVACNQGSKKQSIPKTKRLMKKCNLTGKLFWLPIPVNSSSMSRIRALQDTFIRLSFRTVVTATCSLVHQLNKNKHR